MMGEGTAVLMYHRVSTEVVLPEEAIYTVTPSAFESQMRAVVTSGRPLVGLGHLLGTSFPSGAVSVTFDDGTASDASVALPLLASLAVPACFFVNPATLGRDGFLSWDALEALAAAGMDVGSHGWDHTLLDDVDEATIVSQLRDSKEALEDRLKRPVTALSLPGGTGANRAPEVARRLGYRLVFGSRPAVARESDRNDVLPRFAIRRSDPDHRVMGYVEQRASQLLRARARHRLTSVLRRAAGGALYERGRAFLGARLEREQP